MPSALEVQYAKCRRAYQDWDGALARHIAVHSALYKNKATIDAKTSEFVAALIKFQDVFAKARNAHVGNMQSAFVTSKKLYWNGWLGRKGLMVDFREHLERLADAERARPLDEVACQRIAREVRGDAALISQTMASFLRYYQTGVAEVRVSGLRQAA